ncbi:MAG: DNA double-strand break repair nuclease NurA [Candidatus Sericytochromatia bacterium]
MLNFNKLSSKISNISLELSQESQARGKRLQRALEVHDQAIINDLLLSERLVNNIDKFPWMVGRPLEKLDNIRPLPVNKPEKYTVVSTDGSQIAPSHHEIALCYLVNVGLIMYTYGTGEKPIQESEPFVYNTDDDPFASGSTKKNTPAFSEDTIAIKRMIAEMTELANICKKAKDRGHPTIAMVDGTLINWSISNQMWPEEYQEKILAKFLSILDDIRALEVPVCGYISNSRRNDYVNLLRVQTCPHKEIDCENLCSQKEDCDEIVPLYDRQIWLSKLKEGERSPILSSSAKILEKYNKEHQICFFYLNVGQDEIARIEIPRWVADNEDSLNLMHSLIYDQVQKGRGYPIVIQEAHNQAVVKGPDRAQFYAMLSRRMISEHMTVSISNKELKKRGGIA